MPISFGHSVMIITVVAVCTYFTRAAALSSKAGRVHPYRYNSFEHCSSGFSKDGCERGLHQPI